MKCDHCGKKEANIKYAENINGKKQQLNLCYECAEKLGVINFSNSFTPMFTSMFYDMPELFEEVKCDKCGYTLNDYKKTGLFGCDNCYEVFLDSIDEILLQIHGKNRHVEKSNKMEEIKKDSLFTLKEKLKELVQNEKYEEAALIRDQIKELERKQVK